MIGRFEVDGDKEVIVVVRDKKTKEQLSDTLLRALTDSKSGFAWQYLPVDKQELLKWVES